MNGFKQYESLLKKVQEERLVKLQTMTEKLNKRIQGVNTKKEALLFKYV